MQPLPRLLSFLLLAAIGCGLLTFSAAQAQDKKKEKDPLEGKKGTVLGILVAKEKASIEVKADGEEKARKYVPHWKGGQPSAGGGPDKEMLKIFSELTIGSRIEVQWEFEERLRAVKVKVLKKAEPKEKK